MSLNLTIDQGNSSVKLSLFHEKKCVEFKRVKVLTADTISEFVGEREINATIYSTVAGSGDDILRDRKNILGNIYRMSYSLPMPVTIGVSHPETLGADRIAAVVGANAIFPESNILVIDLGTAATFDYVTKKKIFVGGMISPGLRMRLEALHNYTDRLPIVALEGDEPRWGNDTETALRTGAINGIVAEVEHYARIAGNENTEIVITGGDAKFISEHLTIPHLVKENLVSEGLNEIILFNEFH